MISQKISYRELRALNLSKRTTSRIEQYLKEQESYSLEDISTKCNLSEKSIEEIKEELIKKKTII